MLPLITHAMEIKELELPPIKRCLSAPPDASKTPEEQKTLDRMAKLMKNNYRQASPTCHTPKNFPYLPRSPRNPISIWYYSITARSHSVKRCDSWKENAV